MGTRNTFFMIAAVMISLISVAGAAAAEKDSASKKRANTNPFEKNYQVKRNIVYAEVQKTRLLLDAYIPKASGVHPSLLLVHGGAWSMGDKSHMANIAREAASRGYVCFSIKYRLAPKFKFPAQIEDCRTATRWMVDSAKKYKVDLKRLGAVGYSAGGHLVALLGAQGVKHKTAKGETIIRFGVIGAGGTPTDFRWMPPDAKNLAYWLGGTRGQWPQRYVDASPLAFVSRDSAPMFFYHGEKDALVPLVSPQIMVNTLRQAGVDARLYMIKDANHLSAFGNSKAYATMDQFFQKHLKNPKNDKPGESAKGQKDIAGDKSKQDESKQPAESGAR